MIWAMHSFANTNIMWTWPTDKNELWAINQKDQETFKEYAQRWRKITTQVSPPLEEKEMTKILLNTLGQFYYEKMIASETNDFTEMV